MLYSSFTAEKKYSITSVMMLCPNYFWEKKQKHLSLCMQSWEFALWFSPPDVSLHVIRCKLKCEDNLMPNVGGHFVQNFVANIYHHLQYSYYKCEFSASSWASNHLFNSPSDWEARKMMSSSCAFVFVQWTTAGRLCPARSVTSCLSPKTRSWGGTCTIIKPTVISGALRRSTSHPGRSEAKNETLLLVIQ